MEQVLVREPVWAKLQLPVFSYLGISEMPPHKQKKQWCLETGGMLQLLWAELPLTPRIVDPFDDVVEASEAW